MDSRSAVSRRSRLRNMSLAVAVLVIVAVSTLAQAADVPLAKYSASVLSGTCQAATPCTQTFTVQNESPPDSGFLMNAATINVPAGFSSISVGTPVTTAPIAKTWTATGTTTIRLSANGQTDSLAPTESVSVAVTFTADLSTVGPSNTFSTTASGVNILTQSIGFARNGPEPVVTVVNQQRICPAGSTCDMGSATMDNTTARGTASDGGLTTSEMSVGGSWGGPDCGTSFNPSSEVVTTNVGGGRSHVVTLTIRKKLNGTNNGGISSEEVCLKSEPDKPFTTKGGTVAYEGILPNCDPTNPAITACVRSRHRNAGNSIIVYYAPPGDPEVTTGSLDGLV